MANTPPSKRYGGPGLERVFSRLVSFAAGPEVQSVAEGRAGRIGRQAIDLLMELLMTEAAPGTVIFEEPQMELRRWSATELEQFRLGLLLMIGAVLEGPKGSGLDMGTVGIGRLTFAPLRIGKRVMLLVNGRASDVAWYRILRLFESVGMDRLRRCSAPDCRKPFLKLGRREYCSNRCQKRIYMRSYDPGVGGKGRGTGHGKTRQK